VVLAGLTFDDAKALIQARVSSSVIGVEAFVSMGRLRVIGIFMAGEVLVPWSCSISALSTVTQVLFVAGGVILYGSPTSLRLLLLLLLHFKEVGYFG
jgi:polysaccharide export outer membrane protein